MGKNTIKILLLCLLLTGCCHDRPYYTQDGIKMIFTGTAITAINMVTGTVPHRHDMTAELVCYYEPVYVDNGYQQFYIDHYKRTCVKVWR